MAVVRWSTVVGVAGVIVEVRAVVCAHRADLPWFRRETRGVRTCPAGISPPDPEGADDPLALRLAVRRLPS